VRRSERPKPGKLAAGNHPCGQRQPLRAKPLLGSRKGEHHDHHHDCHRSDARHLAIFARPAPDVKGPFIQLEVLRLNGVR